jgi:hypothetical protein
LTSSSVNQGPGATIRINPKTLMPAVGYYDQTNNALYYNPCSLTAAACASGGWNPQQVEGAAGVGGLTAAMGQLLAAALGFDANGFVYVFYPRGQANDGNLVMATNVLGSFVSEIASHGSNANLPGAPALNFAVAGWGVASTRNSAGFFTTAFVGPGNVLYSSSCGD